jgi:hypothetical protein
MILSVAGVTGTGIVPGQDLSGFIDRTEGFDIESAVGKRIDTSDFVLMDTLPSSMAIPDKAEIIIYDAPPNMLSWAAAILSLQPAAYYRLNDTIATARDWSANKMDAALTGGYTQGQAGGLGDGTAATLFNGTTGTATSPTSPTWNPSGNNPFTFGALVKPTVLNATTQRIMGREPAGNHGVILFVGSDNSWRVLRGDSAAGIDQPKGSINPVAGQFAFVCAVYDGTRLTVWVNGVKGTPATSSRLADTQTAAIQIGHLTGGGSGGMTVDEAFFLNYALTDAQMVALSGLVATATADTQVVDPPWAISAYNTWRNGAGTESTSATAANWTPRLFGGYVATPKYTHDGPQRYIGLASQDYTVRLRTTVANMAFANGTSDQAIIKQIFARYRPDYDTTHVDQVLAAFPAITYPVHTLEQCLERIIKVTRAYYRADYFKQLWYSIVGQQTAPFNLSDFPDNGGLLYANGGFEDADPLDATLPLGWSRLNSVGTGTATRDNTAAHGGTYSMALTNPASANYGAIFNKQGLAVSPGDVLSISLWLKASVAGRVFGPVRVTFANPGAIVQPTGIASAQPSGQAGIAVVDTNFTPTAAFALYTVNVTVPNGYAWAFIELYGNGSTAWPTTFNVDDFSVTRPLPTFPTEGLSYTPDGSGLANRVWVIGSTYLSAQQVYQVPPALVNGVNYQFPLPGNPELTGMSVTVAGVDQGQIGVAPGDGDIAMPSGFKYNAIIQHNPALIAFKVPPTAGQAVAVTGQFRYPLVQVVTDSGLIAAANGVIFEAIVRDKRINDLTLAKSVGQAFLKNQGSTLKGGSCEIRTRAAGGVLLQPGHQITIKNDVLFRNLLKDAAGLPTTTAVVIVTQLRTVLDDDTVQPYKVQVSFADRNVSGGY